MKYVDEYRSEPRFVLVASTAVAIANLVVDVVYAYLDPRVRYA